MQVQDIMTRDVKCCSLETDLAAATEMMWTFDVGALPVVDREGKVAGMITDRDICIALGTRNQPPSNLSVADLISEKVYACEPGDEIHTALQMMRDRRVRRLPIVNREGTLEGMLSLNDVALNAKRKNGLSYEDVTETLKAICEHRPRKAEAAA